jgi:flagellar biosynthesis/type III secretory pathway protein FliH
MSWLSDAWDFLSENKDTVKDVFNFGRNVYNAWDMNNSRQGSRNDILDFMKQMEAQDNAYQQQMYDYNNRQRAAASAAARANDAARRKASKKAFKKQSKMLKELISQYQPYADAAKELTPKMSQNYSQFLDTTALLNQYLTPKAMEVLGSAPKPTWEMGVPQSAYKVSAPQSAPVKFPSLDEILKNK